MEVELQEYQTQESNLSSVGRRSDQPAAEPEQCRRDVQAHAGHDNRNGDEAQVAAAAAHEAALAIAESNMLDHEMQPVQLHDDKHVENDDVKLSSNNDNSDIDIERQQEPAKLVSDASSDDAQTRFQAVQAARKLLNTEHNDQIDKFIESGIVPILVKCLTVDTEPQLQSEAAWALNIIAGGTSQQTRAVVEAGAIPLFVRLLNSPNLDVSEWVACALGKIASSGPELRDQVIELGVVASLVNFINSERPFSLLECVAWTMNSICLNKESLPPATTIQELLPGFYKLIQLHDTEILDNSLLALNDIAGGSKEYIQMIVDLGFVKHLVPQLGHTNDDVKETALYIVGKILSGTDIHRQAVLDEGALSYFPTLLQHPKNQIKKFAASLVSVITAGNQQQVQAVIDANLIPLMVMCLRTGDCETQRYAAKTISNLANCSSVDQIRYCVQQSVILPLCDLLNVEDTEIIRVVLRSIKDILDFVARNKKALKMIKQQIKECGGFEKIRAFRQHTDKKIQNLARNLRWKYLW